MAEYIDREALLRELRLWHMHRNDEMPDYFHYTGIKAWIEALPAADVQPVKHGRWIKPTRVPDSMLDECSVCGFDCGAYTFNYCPNCGADMRGET